MATHKITRKVIIPVKVSPKDDQPVVDLAEVKQQPEEVLESNSPDSGSKPARAKKVCSFCQGKTIPTYTDLGSLRRFLTDRAKIVARERSGVCSRHQRAVSRNIKYARHLALLPFVPKV